MELLRLQEEFCLQQGLLFRHSIYVGDMKVQNAVGVVLPSNKHKTTFRDALYIASIVQVRSEKCYTFAYQVI